MGYIPAGFLQDNNFGYSKGFKFSKKPVCHHSILYVAWCGEYPWLQANLQLQVTNELHLIEETLSVNTITQHFQGELVGILSVINS